MNASFTCVSLVVLFINIFFRHIIRIYSLYILDCICLNTVSNNAVLCQIFSDATLLKKSIH